MSKWGDNSINLMLHIEAEVRSKREDKFTYLMLHRITKTGQA